MTYPETIQYLEFFINYEKIPFWPYKESLKLERFKGFLNLIGNPQNDLRCIHVAGTKGKGSTCAFIAYILKEAGFKAGLYTSPHLSDFRERIRILDRRGRKPPSNRDFEGIISRKRLVSLVARLKAAIEDFNQKTGYGPLSFFEVYTALAFLYFKEKKTDFVVLETGLGGRLDATNAANSLVAVITPVSYEHTQKLGNTLKEIASEKAGIIKGLRPIVICAPQEKEAMRVIRQRCEEAGAKLLEAGAISGSLKISLLGKHQRINAAAAVAAVEALREYNIYIGKEAVKRGLKRTFWPGRCEVISRRPLLVLDGAQNVASMRAIKTAVKENFRFEKLVLVLGISRDKDISGACREIKNSADEIILTKANNPRATAPRDLLGYFSAKKTYLAENVMQAIRLAKEKAGKRDLILVTGSLFVVGEAREILTER